jgi:hypothetical protein
MAKLVQRVKLVTECSRETTEVEMARIERDQQACPTSGSVSPRRNSSPPPSRRRLSRHR